MLVAVFALEVGSMFAIVLVAACIPNTECNAAPDVPTERPTALVGNTAGNAETPENRGAERASTPAHETPEQGVPEHGGKLAVADDPAERLLAMLHERGGEIFGAQRTIGKALGISAAQTNRVLHDLAASGRIAVITARNGTRVKLAVSPKSRRNAPLCFLERGESK